MSDWTSGYVADIEYTYGYYQELNPLRIQLAFLNAGLIPPDIGTACELGFGQGVSVNVHAAASVTQWYGTDFNSSQASLAQDVAKAAGAGAKLYDDTFLDFINRPELPEFDYIGLHGIWSWISEENRWIIVDFIRRKLKVGGVLYISYNTQPGWASFVPMRELMNEHADILGTPGEGIVSRINGALEFSEKLQAVNPAYMRANPGVSDRINRMKAHDRSYLAHEYFNRDWEPMLFSKMASYLEKAKLNFACSANYLNHIDGINLTDAQQAFLKDIKDANFRQSVRDFMVNQQFRKDYWVKGKRNLNTLERAEKLRAVKLVLCSPISHVSLKVNCGLGKVNLTEEIYKPILDSLSDHQPKTLRQLEDELANKGIDFSQIVEASIVLIGANHLHAVENDSQIERTKNTCQKLNNYLINKSRGGADIGYLASPVTGGAINVERVQQLFLLAISEGKEQPEQWAEFVWSLISAQGQKFVIDGKKLETPEENITELTIKAKAFSKNKLPILQALQIA